MKLLTTTLMCYTATGFVALPFQHSKPLTEPLTMLQRRRQPVMIGRKQRREEKFDALLDEMSLEDETIIRVEDPRLATILRGVRAVRDDEKVRRAFEILYCDIAPIRLAGELVFRQLKKVTDKQLMDVDPVLVQSLESFDAADVVAARQLFKAMDQDGDNKLTRDELLRFGLLRSLGQCDNCSCNKVDTCQSLDRFVQEVDHDGSGHISFLDFMLRAGRALYLDTSVDLTSVLRPRSKAADNFDKMVEEFAFWSRQRRTYYGNDNPEVAVETRLATVLDGCFAGAEDRHVVAALRVVFEDYDSLRVCADLIFKIMRSTAKKAPWYDVVLQDDDDIEHHRT